MILQYSSELILYEIKYFPYGKKYEIFHQNDNRIRNAPLPTLASVQTYEGTSINK